MKPAPTHCPWCAEPLGGPDVVKCRSCGEAVDKQAALAPARLGSGDPFDPTDAIKWPFDDPDWIKKTLVGAGMLFLSLFSILFLFIPLFLLMGYQVRIARQQRDHPGSRPMPEWDDFGGLIKDGFFFFIALLLPPMLIGVVMVLAMGVLMAVLIGSGPPPAGGGPPPVFFVGIMGFYGFIFLFSILYSYLVPAILMEYVETGSAAACFRFGEIWRRVTTTDYLLLFAIDFVVNMLGSMGAVACYVGMFFTIPLGMYVRAGLVGRYLAREHARQHGLLS